MDLVRRDHGRFRKKWLVFHGTASPALEGIVRAGGVVPWNVLRVRGIRTPTGEQFYTLLHGDTFSRAVSVTRSPEQAFQYALMSRTLALSAEDDIGSELRNLREYLKDVRRRGDPAEWESFHSYVRSLSGRIVSFFSKRAPRAVVTYPVLVATVARERNPAERYAPYAVTAENEELLVQLPIHKSYFFVPHEFLDHARKVLSKRGPRYAERVFPLDVLEKLYGKRLL